MPQRRAKGRLVTQMAGVMRAVHHRRHFAVALLLGLVASGVALWQLTLPEFLSFYDTGVYVGAAIHFVNGTIPYAHFTFVEPPGIVVILSPIAVLGHFIGSSGVLATARALSVVVSGINVAALAWLVRAHGWIAMVGAGLALSTLPVSAYVDSGVKLDLYCVFFVLLSALTIFGGTSEIHQVSRRRTLAAGMLMGAALLVKFIAFFPLIAAILLVARRSRRQALEFGAAAAGIFAVVCTPFFVEAPRNFISQVFIDQVVRRGSMPFTFSEVSSRLRMLTGFGYSAYQPSTAVAVAVLVLAGVTVISATLRRGRSSDTDDFLSLSGVLLAVGLMLPDHTSNYYFYVPAPFLIGAVVTSIARLAPPNIVTTLGTHLGERSKTVVKIATALTAAVVIAGSVLWATTIDQAEAWAFGVETSWSNVLRTQIPEGACVVYSQVYFGLAADRFTDDGARCPHIVDSYGMWLAWGDDPLHPPPAFLRLWQRDFNQSAYAVLSYGSSSNIPWTPNLRAWFKTHFRLLHTDRGFRVYERVMYPGDS